ncbi:MAG: hypothetical protein WAT99_04800, partial [Nitrospira sp.]
GSPLGPSTYCTSTRRGLRTPRAGLATRLSDFVTNRHEYAGYGEICQRRARGEWWYFNRVGDGKVVS